MLKNALLWPLDFLLNVKALLGGDRSATRILSIANPLAFGALFAYMARDRSLKLPLFYLGAGLSNHPVVNKHLQPPPKHPPQKGGGGPLDKHVVQPFADEVVAPLTHPFFPMRKK